MTLGRGKLGKAKVTGVDIVHSVGKARVTSKLLSTPVWRGRLSALVEEFERSER